MIKTAPKKIRIEPKQKEIEKAKSGDHEAMHKLYVQYAAAMLNTSFRILNNKEDAEDALQESFIKAFSHLDQYKYESTFGAWFKRIVVNHCIDKLRKKRKIVFIEEGDIQVLDTAEEAETVNNLQERLDALYKALHQMPDGYRTVLSLYLLEGYDHQEIAEILKIEVSTSISQLSRGKKKLKSLMVKE